MYRALLHLYPKSFRGEYEGEMCAVFSQRLRDTSGFERITLWIETLFDVLFNAARVHLDIFGQDLRYFGRTLRQSPGYALTVVAIAAPILAVLNPSSRTERAEVQFRERFMHRSSGL